MIYFVPAWYTDPEHWSSGRKPWYREKKQFFDAFLSQMRMFVHEGEDVCLLNPAHTTGFRRFRFAEDLGNLPCWSVFDVLQGIEIDDCVAFSFKDLPWPEGMEWVYTPFLIWGYLRGERKVRIEFAAAGDLSEISFYEGERIFNTYQFDERGFISVVYRYKEGRPPYAYYLNPDGQIRFRENRADKTVDTAATLPVPLARHRYACLGDLVKKALKKKLDTLGESDTVIIESHPLHNTLFLDKDRHYKTALFLQGNSSKTCPREDLDKADLLVTDSEWEKKRILWKYPDLKTPFMVIAPVDTRLEWGKSSETKKKKIFLEADSVDDHELSQILSALQVLLKSDQDIELYAAAEAVPNKGRDTQKEELSAKIEKLSDLHVDREEDESLGENSELQQMLEETPDNVFVRIYSKIPELEKILGDCRLIIDLAEEPSELLQIAGISMGIPQIHKAATRYIDHLKEGYVVYRTEEIETALRYYLYNLQNWNEAFMNCVRKVEAYSGRAIVDKWINRIEDISR